MSKTRKILLVTSFIMLIAHIVRYFLYNEDIIQASFGIITMIFIIMSVIMNKKTEKRKAS
ncbi:hypothetical protein [Flavobacterium hydatis]|jgi:hypothetical protein|uniref:Uncharacterized protein n=1 Tax=Flavobacterium hydatis TaxID=991 RepID=A0A086AMR4_FLAHY|nr:hypothetical protein [Flavobacterium hydatis]KFF17978.1 hypothetical protein IW20_06820 [Flavobacterium hydatis]OXA90856.1 hypothetical protein B0A62_18745 [Flavobacterium hydatis]